MSNEISIRDLERLPIFRGLNFDNLTEVKKNLKSRTPTGREPLIHQMVEDSILAPGNEVLAPPSQGVFIILRGTLKIFVAKEDEYKRDVVLAILGSGEIVGELSIVDRLGYSATVQARGQTELLYMRRDDFIRCLALFPSMNTNLAHILTRRLRVMNAIAKSRALPKLAGSIGRLILIYALIYGVKISSNEVYIPVYMTHEDMASLLFSDRTQVTTLINDYANCLINKNCIYTIKDIEKFIELVSQNAPGNETESMVRQLRQLTIYSDLN